MKLLTTTLAALILAAATIHPQLPPLSPLLNSLTLENAHRTDEAVAALKVYLFNLATLLSMAVFAFGFIVHELRTLVHYFHQLRRAANGGKSTPPSATAAPLKRSPGESSPAPGGAASHT